MDRWSCTPRSSSPSGALSEDFRIWTAVTLVVRDAVADSLYVPGTGMPESSKPGTSRGSVWAAT